MIIRASYFARSCWKMWSTLYDISRPTLWHPCTEMFWTIGQDKDTQRRNNMNCSRCDKSWTINSKNIIVIVDDRFLIVILSIVHLHICIKIEHFLIGVYTTGQFVLCRKNKRLRKDNPIMKTIAIVKVSKSHVQCDDK